MNKEALRATAAAIRAGYTGFTFDMGVFVDHRGCGTACCIAGWAVLAAGDQLVEDQVEGRAISILGLTHTEADLLFYAQGSGRYLSDIEPEEAARVLERAADTGEIDWNNLGRTHDVSVAENIDLASNES